MGFNYCKSCRILKVDDELIKKWAYHFSEYLSRSANPDKGVTRLFAIESIKMGLNAKEQYEYPNNELATVLTPIFRDIPHDIEERSASAALLVALSEFTDLYFIANSYKNAGDVLVNSAIENENAYELIYPIIYNYRHSIELYLKDSITNRQPAIV